MGKKTKLALLIGALAALVSAVVLVVVFWDRLLELCPCCCKNDWDEELPEEEFPEFTDTERSDFADLNAE